jgi:hypothetical protein
MKIRFFPLVVTLFVATAVRAQAPQPQSPPSTPQSGEIELSGTVSSVEQGGKSFVLQAQSYALPGTQKMVALTAPKPKSVTVDANTKWARLRAGSPLQVEELADTPFADFKVGMAVSIIGRDLGTGKALPARLIKTLQKAPSSRRSATTPAEIKNRL